MTLDVEGKVTLDREPVDAAFTAHPSDRLIVPRERQARRPSAVKAASTGSQLGVTLPSNSTAVAFIVCVRLNAQNKLS